MTEGAITGELASLHEQVTRLESMALRAWCAQRSASERAATTFRVVMWLGLIGAGVAVIFSGLFVTAETATDAGPGALVLLAGMTAFALLLRRSPRSPWQTGG